MRLLHPRPVAPFGRRAVRSFAAVTVLCLLPHGAAPLGAQVTQPWRLPAAATIPLGDPVYTVLDELLHLVPVPGGIVGQRPYSRREVTRLVQAADAELLRRTTSRTEDRQRRTAASPGLYVSDEAPRGEQRAAALVQLLRDAYDVAPPAERSELGIAPSPWRASGRPVDAIAVGLWGTRAPARRVLPIQNGLGTIDATTLPPLDARAGRPAIQGATWNLETMHSVGVGQWLALVAQPRVSYLAPYGAAQQLNIEPQRLFARATLANVAVQVGIDEVNWGQGGARSLFLSSNARPLRQLSVGADTAFRLPWVFAGLGRWRAGLLVADLGTAQHFAHSKLAAYKVSLTPVSRLELGAGLMSQFGGRGAPPLTFRQRTIDLFPFIGWLNEGSDRIASNKVATADARLHLPELRGTTLYYELAMDDFDLRRVGSMLGEDSGHLLGITVGRLRGDGTLSLDVRGHHTSLRLYRHYQFANGLTYRGQILGDPLGPDARALYATLAWRPTLGSILSLELAAEDRDPSTYINANADPDATLDFVKDTRGLLERRQRALLAFRTLPVGSGIAVTARGGAEVVRDENFVQGPRRQYGVGELGVQFRF